MSKAVKYAERAVTIAAQGAWSVFERLNRISPNESFTPKWSDKPLLKSYQKEKPPLGWPRTDRKSTRLNSSHLARSRMPSSA